MGEIYGLLNGVGITIMAALGIWVLYLAHSGHK